MKFEKIKEGMTLYDVHKTKAGNTTLMTVGVWPVRIISVDQEKRTAQASWNGNKATTYFESSLSKLREKKPLLITRHCISRLATREEIAAHKAKQKEATP